MDLIEIKGKINTAICYARVVEDEAIEQIRRMCDYPMTEGSRIFIPLRLMKIHWTRHRWHTRVWRTSLM